MSSNYKHLTLDERKEIERMLNNGLKLSTISKKIGKSDKCVRYELTHYRILKPDYKRSNHCGNFYQCEKMHLCSHCLSGQCRYCRITKCNEVCDDFVSEPNCKRIKRFPFVCNGCKKIDSCILPKYMYYGEKADFSSRNINSSWRKKIRKSDQQLKRILECVSVGTKNGISLDVIINTDHLDVSLSTLYRYIDQRRLGEIMNIDLKRKVRYTFKAKKKVLVPIDYDYLKGRRFEDYHQFVSDSLPVNIWQIDTVMGIKSDSKCILSLLHCSSNLQLFFLMDSCDCLNVTKVFDKIKASLGVELFKMMFEVILTDNGREFKDPLSIEADACTGEIITRVFFCESRRSDQKGKCEKNHEHYREILPKGFSIEKLNQSDIDYVSLMVNNYPRRLLSFKSPFDLASLILNKKVLALNRLRLVPTSQVKLTPFKK